MTVQPVKPSQAESASGDSSSSFALDVGYYLSQEPPQLPSRYLYDALGSSLFEAICQLPWYPITRAETRLLSAHGPDVFAAAGPLFRIVELGCGKGEKLATLIGTRPPSAATLDVHLIDVSPTALSASVSALHGIDDVRIITHEVPYETGLLEIRDRPARWGRTLMLFLGSNIGNFDPAGADEFLREIRAALNGGDLFLLGADLVKPEAVLQLAYDDPLGVTAAFNKNILVRINRELGGDFNLGTFTHRAVWNADLSRVEMHLVSVGRQSVRVEAAELTLTFEDGESIWTESSYKYQPAGISRSVERAGFATVAQWIDDDAAFALTLFAAS
jgi:dimethylhistidine N-methyltransferase